MADLPLDVKARKPLTKEVRDQQIKVTPENAQLLTVQFLSLIYARLGYMVKLLEEKK